LPKEFGEALKQKIPRPFIFGPIEFSGLNRSELEDPFDHEQVRAYVEEQLIKCPYLYENICIHGFKVCVKKRTLKRRTSIVKHSRFLRNLEVYPIFPPEPVVIAQEEEEGGEKNPDEEDNQE